jgi:TATA-box binding protein (TBP) (component of TFIID and TFIIIB)
MVSSYRVSKIKDKQHEATESKDFDNLADAETYAQKTSLYDDNHFYSVERKIEDEYQAIKFFKSGQVTVTF